MRPTSSRCRRCTAADLPARWAAGARAARPTGRNPVNFVCERSAVPEARNVAKVSTTVDRAGALLKLLSKHPEGLTITVLTRELGTQRAPLYRILEALAVHQLVRRD